MNETYKEKLSQHVENIFRGYITPGLHICDFATGGGKSYTIGKLTCTYYPKMFDRIVILCVQTKLVEGINREIERFIDREDSLIKHSDKLVVENNTDVIVAAIKNHSLEELLSDIGKQVEALKANQANEKLDAIQRSYNTVKRAGEELLNLTSLETLSKSAQGESQMREMESNLRSAMYFFFETYKQRLEKTNQFKKVPLNTILKLFPSFVKVYPQVEYRSKKVLMMTIHKAMYGIDPILSEKVWLQDLANNKKTLIIFDESDQAAIAMRNCIIDQSIESAEGNNRYAKGYSGYLQYKELINQPVLTSKGYYGELLEEKLQKAQSITKKNWEKLFFDTPHYNNIFLAPNEDYEGYRRGVFFSGPVMKLNISKIGMINRNGMDKYVGGRLKSYICFKSNDRHFYLAHTEDETRLKGIYKIVLPLDKFLTLSTGNIKVIKHQLYKVIAKSLKISRERFEQETKAIALNLAYKKQYLGYPTLEREIHTLFARFETISAYHFEKQMSEFVTNRKSLSIKIGGHKIKMPDYSVYAQGMQFFQEEIDERDNQHRVRISCREIATTPESILIKLVNTENTSIVLCSATASSMSVVSNFDIEYLKQSVQGGIHLLSDVERATFDELVSKTYPTNHKIEVVPLLKYDCKDKREGHIKLPEKYREMFSQEAQEEGLPDIWFSITRREILGDSNKMIFELCRLYQFIEAYHWFITHDDIHSMIYFQNRDGFKDKRQYQVLSCLIDGTYKSMKPSLENEIPLDWKDPHIRISKDKNEVENSILSELSQNKDAKLMLVTAYGSFKAGVNLQYEILEGLKYVAGDNWINEGERLKKDWDAIYLQSPTAYLMMNEDGNETNYEKSLYNIMLTLMMLYERGCLSKSEVRQWLYNALSGNFKFSEKKNSGIFKDKAAWAQTTIEQAIGRLCRTRNKPSTTYILFDESMIPFFKAVNLEKSLTKEFRALATYILNHQEEGQGESNQEEAVLCNKANKIQNLLNHVRKIALRYTPHLNDEEMYDDFEDEKEIPYHVISSQFMIQSFKQTILKKPAIASIDELSEVDKHLYFIADCYGEWQRNEDGELFFSFDSEFNEVTCKAGRGTSMTVSPSSVRLDVMMKNPVIKAYFEKKGYATSWKSEGLILHPLILAYDYAGEIGEEAFKAILLHYTDCKEEDIKHLEGKEYELADFVIMNPDGSYRVAFDVKNMNPDYEHNDRPGDMPTSQKREIKHNLLGCGLITVNMLQLKADGMDEIREIGGVIDADGNVIPSAIELLRKHVNRN